MVDRNKSEEGGEFYPFSLPNPFFLPSLVEKTFAFRRELSDFKTRRSKHLTLISSLRIEVIREP